jgi:hypothetical protein
LAYYSSYQEQNRSHISPSSTHRLPSCFPLSSAKGATPTNFDTAFFDRPDFRQLRSTRATVLPATALIDRNASTNFSHSGSLDNSASIFFSNHQNAGDRHLLQCTGHISP